MRPRGNFATSLIDTVKFRWHGEQLLRKTCSMSGSRISGGPYFFLAGMQKKIHIKSNLALCGIRYHAESYAYLFFYEKRRA